MQIDYVQRDRVGLYTVDYRVRDGRFVVRDGSLEDLSEHRTRAEAFSDALARAQRDAYGDSESDLWVPPVHAEHLD